MALTSLKMRVVIVSLEWHAYNIITAR